jgi:hypothetical protein
MVKSFIGLAHIYTVAISNIVVISILNTGVVYGGKLTLVNVGAAVNYCSIFITLAPGFNV